MTSAELVELATGFRWLKDQKILVDEAEVYLAANLAQNFLVSDLHPFDAIGYLGVTNGQELYAYSRGTISAASQTAPIVITEAGHLYHTGDRVTVYGVGGNTNANGAFTVTRVSDSQYSLDGSSGNAAYTSGGYSYHCLMGALIIASDLYNTTSKARVQRALYDQLLKDELVMAAGNLQFFYALEQVPQGLSIGFQGVPAVDAQFKFHYERIPLPHERISATVDPWQVDDLLLYYRTMFHIMDIYKQSDGDSVDRKALDFLQKYQMHRPNVINKFVRKKWVSDIEGFESVRFR
jgi:hypothetical protein